MDGGKIPWGFLVLLAILASSVRAEKRLVTRVDGLRTLAHDVRGNVFGLGNDKLVLQDFSYDGTGPAGYFYVGLRNKPGAGSTPNDGGEQIPDENGKFSPLKRYTRQTVILSLPSHIRVDNIRWFSVWCKDFAVDFGHVIFPSQFREGVSRKMNGIQEKAHDVRSSSFELQSEQTIVIEDFEYDGQGPDAFFIVGNGNVGQSGYKKIPDERGQSGVLRRYNRENIKLTLPAGMRISDYDYFSVYCISFTQDFGNIRIPSDLNLPEFIEIGTPPVVTTTPTPSGTPTTLENCLKLDEKLIVAWTMNTSHIKLELIGVIRDSYYMAFGLSGSNSRFRMTGSDVIVASYDFRAGPMAIDYTLTAYAQCSNGNGACPDVATNDGTADVMVIGGGKRDGVTRVMVVRKLDTGDNRDKRYQTGGQQIVWATGPLNQDKLVTKHDRRINANKIIDFGQRIGNSNCGTLTPDAPSEVEPWPENRIIAKEDTTFTVRIGPAGGDKGYTGITGQQSWGIAYYINDLLIPVLELRRGMTYTFRIEAGNDDSNTAQYHPFYITDDDVGGYVQKSAEMKRAVNVFAGITNGQPSANAVGRYCEYVTTARTGMAEDHDTFSDYFNTLTLDCDQPRPTGELVWTVPLNAPDELYYQCFTHRRLGWKITFAPASSAVKIAASFWALLVATWALYIL